MSIPPPSSSGTALVTGASSGIGADFARLLAKAGHHVTLVARTTAKLDELAAEIGNGTVIGCDLADRAARARLAEDVAAHGRAVDVLVNNAGFGTGGPVSRAELDTELDMVEVNVAAVTDLTTRFVAGMVERGRGAVLNVASSAAFQPIPGQAAYAATKAYVLAYSHALAAEVRQQGISVTALCPGPVDTGFVDTAGFTQDEAEATLPKFLWVPSEEVARQGLAGLEAGRAVVVPGLGNRVGGAFARHLPRRPLTALLARQHPKLP